VTLEVPVLTFVEAAVVADEIRIFACPTVGISAPNTLSLCVTTVSTKFDVVNFVVLPLFVLLAADVPITAVVERFEASFRPTEVVDDFVTSVTSPLAPMEELSLRLGLCPLTTVLPPVAPLFTPTAEEEDVALPVPFRFPLTPAFTMLSDSFSGEESDPLSAGIGLYGGIVFTLPPFLSFE